MRVRLGQKNRQKLNRGPLKAVMCISAKVKVYGTPGSGGTVTDDNFRLLEDGDFRLLEDGSFRLLE